MSNERIQLDPGSLLASIASAAPFAPTSSSPQARAGWGSGSSTSSANALAKPFVPAAERTNSMLGAGARPFVPGSNSGSEAALSAGNSRINANATAFVPASSSSPRVPAMSTNAPAFVPKGAALDPMQGRRLGSPAEPRLRDGEQRAFGFPAIDPLPEPRVGSGHGTSPRISPHPSPRQSGGGYPPAGSRMGRARLEPGPGGRILQERPFDGGGHGRGRGRGGPFPRSGSQPRFGHNQSALARAQHNAQAMADQLLPQLQTHAYLTMAQMSPEMQAETRLPEAVRQFHSLYPMEDPRAAEEASSKAFGVQSLVLKGVSMHDGQAYALRRISRRQVPPTQDMLAHAADVVHAWSPLAGHPGLCVPRGAFASPEPAAIFVTHDFRTAAATLEAARLQPQVTANGLVQVAAAGEDVLWSYLTQLAAALRAVHSMGLACRSALHPSKLLVTTGDRLLVGSLGVAEIVAGRAARQDDVASLQLEDLRSVGGVMLQLACAALPHPSLEILAAQYSPEFTRVVASLLGQQSPIVTWRQLTAALGEHALAELDAQALYTDAITAQLAREAENGRLLRLLAKLSMVTERADADPEWAETGDRYLLKLFRDFVFHQCSEEGAPLLEWGHVVECLAKLDAGVPERVLLLSRDEASMLVVSYADIRRCLAGAFGELKSLAGQR